MNALLDYHRRQLCSVINKGSDDLASERHRVADLEKNVAGITEKVSVLESLEDGRSAELTQSRLEVEALRADKKRLEMKYAELDESSRKKHLRMY